MNEIFHMRSKHFEENGYGHNLDLLIISHQLRVSGSTRSGCRGKYMFKTHLPYVDEGRLVLNDYIFFF